MSMKPRIESSDPAIPGVVSSSNSHPGNETSPNIKGTVTTKKTMTNSKVAPNLVSEPHKG